VWQQISDEAKDLISKLLERQADMRFTAEEAFNHPWIQR
jgi:serine/threonine protein kinase